MRTFVVTAAAVAALTLAARAQQPLFKAGVDVVRVDVSVTDHGKPVRGLTGDNFALTDDGTAEAVSSVTLEQLPLRVVLMLDTSGSVEGQKLAALIQASHALIAALRPTDRIAVVTFSGEVEVLSPFGASRTDVDDALGRVRAGGSTALYDALQIAFELVRLDDAVADARPLIIVCSDGLDTGSWLSGDNLLDAARRADVVVHTIEPPDAPTFGLVTDIDAIAKLSGGRSWTANSGRDLKSLFTDTLAEMRDRYLLTFSPEAPARPGWHVLKVTLKHAKGDVLARPGYYVNATARPLP
jgi:VWFA-related protein